MDRGGPDGTDESPDRSADGPEEGDRSAELDELAAESSDRVGEWSGAAGSSTWLANRGRVMGGLWFLLGTVQLAVTGVRLVPEGDAGAIGTSMGMAGAWFGLGGIYLRRDAASSRRVKTIPFVVAAALVAAGFLWATFG